MGMAERIFKHRAQIVDTLTARLVVVSGAAVIALYVLVSMIAALARFPGQETDGIGRDRYRTAVVVPGPEEARGPWTQDIVPSPYRDRVAAARPGAASGNPITAKASIGIKVARVSEPRGMVGCTLSTPPRRLTRPGNEITR